MDSSQIIPGGNSVVVLTTVREFFNRFYVTLTHPIGKTLFDRMVES